MVSVKNTSADLYRIGAGEDRQVTLQATNPRKYDDQIARIDGELADLSEEVGSVKEDLSDVDHGLTGLTDRLFRRNLFDGEYVHAAVLLYTATGTGKMDFANTSGRTAIIPVNANTTYWIARYDASNRWRVFTSTEYPTADTVMTMKYDAYTTGQAVTTGADEKYIIVNVSTTEQEPRLCVTTFEQERFIAYEWELINDPSEDISELRQGVEALEQKDDSIADDVFLIKSAVSDIAVFNLFEGSYAKVGVQRVSSEEYDIITSDVSRTAIIKIRPNTKYYVKRFDDSNRFRAGTCDHYPVIGDVLTPVYNNNTGYFTFTSAADAQYLAVLVSANEQEPRLCVTESDVDEYLAYDDFVKKDSESVSGSKKYYFLDDFVGTVSCPSTIDGGSTTDTVNLQASEPSVITNIYDALLTDFSAYVTKTDIATVEQYSISQYDFSYMRINNRSARTIRKPKIAISTGTHGYEQGGCWCVAQFMNSLYRDTTSDLLAAIRENVDFSIIPVVNPYGFAHNERKNENGIDINRNFNAGSISGADPSSDSYGGTTAESEVGTQALIQFLTNNSDADFVIDYHNTAGDFPHYFLYTDEQASICNALFTTLTRQWKKEYSGFPTDQLLGFCTGGTNGSFAYYATKHGFNSFTLETPWCMSTIGSKKFDKPTIMTGVDTFANTLLTIIKSFR